LSARVLQRLGEATERERVGDSATSTLDDPLHRRVAFSKLARLRKPVTACSNKASASLRLLCCFDIFSARVTVFVHSSKVTGFDGVNAC
jgi:hypothetical protein